MTENSLSCGANNAVRHAIVVSCVFAVVVAWECRTWMLACVFVVVAVVVVVALECTRPAWACLDTPLKTPSGLLV